MVAIAVCSLTMSLATRYYSLPDTSSHPVGTVQRHSSPDAKQQRLAKNTPIGILPVFSFTVLRVPSFRLRTTSAQPPVRSLICDESLYNRPPPAFKFFS